MNEAALPPTPAPGARGAKLCGIWSIVASLTCVGIPVGIVLAIIALVQQAKANRLAKENPDFYERPAATGLVTGIIGLAMPLVMLPFLGIVSAITIPALLSQRARARDMAATLNTVKGVGDLTAQYDMLAMEKTPPEQVPGALEAWLRQNATRDRNPWDETHQAPVYNFHIEVLSGLDQDSVGEMAASEATTLGQPVFVIELPANGQPGYLSGAVRLQNPHAGANPFVKTVELE
jgi:hypothetical protein